MAFMTASRLRLALIPFPFIVLLLIGFHLSNGPMGAGLEPVGMRLKQDPPGQWRALDGQTLATWTGPYLLQYRVQLTRAEMARPLGIIIGVRGASEATWDAEALPPNGVVGNSVATEIPGRIDWIVPVPPARATVGTHTLIIRASSQRLSRGFSRADLQVRVQALDDLYGMRYRAWLLPTLAMGCLLVAALYVGAVIARTGARQGAWALLGLCLVGLVLPMLEAWRPLVGYPYDLHRTRLLAIRVLTALSALLLPAYFALRFDAHPTRARRVQRVLYGLAILIITIFAATFDLANWLLHVSGLSMSLLITYRAARHDPEGSAGMFTVLLGTTLAAALIAPPIYIDGLYMIAFAAILVTVLLAHAGYLRAGAERSVALEAARARLSTALLRHSIHPHWLMNTLTSLQELIERSPANASRMVELLGDEFRLVRAASEEAWIAVDDEIALCRTHLAIVSIGRPRPLVLHLEGASLWQDLALPPGVLHTLVENGLTHGVGMASPHDAIDPQPDFLLQAERVGDTHLILRMSVLMSIRMSVALRTSGTARTGMPGAPGTGTRFIEASLRTAFDTDWRFEQNPQDTRWVSVMTLPRAVMHRGWQERGTC